VRNRNSSKKREFNVGVTAGVVVRARVARNVDGMDLDLLRAALKVNESGPLRAVHLSRHKWPGGLVNHGLGEGICCPHSLGLRVPHSGVRPVHQKSNCITQLTLGPYVVKIWSRNTPESGPNETRVAKLVVGNPLPSHE